MRDPVELPSGNVLDRKVAMRIIMSGDYDPFTKVPALHLHPLLQRARTHQIGMRRFCVAHTERAPSNFRSIGLSPAIDGPVQIDRIAVEKIRFK